MTSSPQKAKAKTTPLFDELGPRGQARLRMATIISTVVVVAIVVGAVAQLASAGQFANVLWQPLTKWPNLHYLLTGLKTTLYIGLSGAAMSMAAGVLAALGRLSRSKWLSLPCAGLIELFRSVPLILLAYFFLIGVPQLGLGNMPPYWTLATPIVLHAGAVFAEIVRAGVLNLARGQSEAGLAIGLRGGQVMRMIVLPQVLLALRPQLITQLIRTLKESALGYVVSYPELVRDGQVLSEFNGNFLQTYMVIAVVFIIINYGLSQLAENIDKIRLPVRRGRGPVIPIASTPDPVGFPTN